MPKTCAICARDFDSCTCVEDAKQVDLPSLLERDGVRLHPSGRGYRACCPLHQGDNPQGFSVTEKDGIWFWNCFTGCGTGGDAISYARKKHNYKFQEAVAWVLGQKLLPLEMKSSNPRQRMIENPTTLSWNIVEHYFDIGRTKRSWWYAKGLSDEAIDRFYLGYCPHAPLVPASRQAESFTIPIVHDGKVLNIRHRLAQPHDHIKYLPHAKGLGSHVFNAHSLYQYPDGSKRTDADEVLLVEGEIKTMVACDQGVDELLPVISGTAGADFWLSERAEPFLPMLDRYKRILLCLDPDKAGVKAAERVALARFGRKAHILHTPDKLDDWLLADSRNLTALVTMIGAAQPIRSTTYWSMK